MPDITSPPDVAGTTTTTGSGPFIISGPVAVPGTASNYRQWVTIANGSRVHCIRSDVGGQNFERGIVDVANVAGVVTLTFNPRLETSAGGSSAISWSGGTQNVFVLSGSVHPGNGFTEYSSYAAIMRAAKIVEPAFATNTALIACQSTAPTGYTQDVSANDRVLRMVSGGTGGATGGSWTITGCTVGGHVLTLAELANHTHGLWTVVNTFPLTAGGSVEVVLSVNNSLPGAGATRNPNVATAGSDTSHSHPFVSDASWRMAYRDVMVILKAAT